MLRAWRGSGARMAAIFDGWSPGDAADGAWFDRRHESGLRIEVLSGNSEGLHGRGHSHSPGPGTANALCARGSASERHRGGRGPLRLLRLGHPERFQNAGLPDIALRVVIG